MGPHYLHIMHALLNYCLSVLLDSYTDEPTSASFFFGFMGCASALVFACFGAAYGTAKSGVGVAAMGVMRPDLVMRSIIPIVMAGVIGIYGLIIAVITQTKITTGAGSYSLYNGFAHLAGGLAGGLSGLA